MRLIILENKAEIAQLVSRIVIDFIAAKPNLVLGLATGSSPIETYQLLVDDAKKNKTDWSKVITFNLDEYVSLSPENKHSYRYFMNYHLFNHLPSLKLNNTFLPSGIGNLQQNANDYEKLIRLKGPIDLQILGVGNNGHIGFNEPGSQVTSKTRIVELTPETIAANKRFFANINDVPTHAITMGIATILQARWIILIANGASKAQAIYQLIHGKVTSNYPCTFLQNHEHVTIIIDKDAAQLLEAKLLQPQK